MSDWDAMLHEEVATDLKKTREELAYYKRELAAVMHLAVDKWLDDNDTEGSPAERAARAREVVLKLLEKNQ